ncbi:MAG: DNA mismatch repair endonuclease MutL [Lachnospiraceae bacterium]|nr:DNA mismatch repair endonuclease MutL [Lachnospiraceae bacterium]
MPNIQVLDQITIDKIAAGEVIERPASIVKELVENAIDAKATAVTVEIKDGGISMIRIADNGCGIPKEEVPLAFLRHSTSKIRSVEDLTGIASLGFRGEALSSIAAIAQVELRTKVKDADAGTQYRIEGGIEKALEEIGMPDGTTFFIRQIFFNTPARRKFLKTPMTEASHVSELITRLALSHPEISFQFLTNGQPKLHTSGNGRLKDVIYHIYGRDITANLLEVNAKTSGVAIRGYIGKPLISRGNRNYENYYINGRYVKSSIIAKAIEDAYKGFTMQHKYPFTVLHFTVEGTDLDVNVHPTKMEVRFSNQQEVYNFIYNTLKDTLNEKELIPRVELSEAKPVSQKSTFTEKTENPPAAEKFRSQENTKVSVKESPQEEPHAGEPAAEKNLDYFMKKMRERVTAYHNQSSQAEVKDRGGLYRDQLSADRIKEAAAYRAEQKKRSGHSERWQEEPYRKEYKEEEAKENKKEIAQLQTQKEAGTEEQLNFFDQKLLSKEAKQEYTLVGQVFETYWIVEYREQMYIIDQHAAHERVLYERTLKQLKEKQFTSQRISPPIILNLSMQEEQLLSEHMESFTKIGFEIEPFGGDSYAVRAVPDNLFGIAKKDLLIEMLDSLSDSISTKLEPDIILEKIASMSCKAAVKGNSRLSGREVDALIGELLELDNPYHCPHGRPTIIAMTKRELEKKFKRIV